MTDDLAPGWRRERKGDSNPDDEGITAKPIHGRETISAESIEDELLAVELRDRAKSQLYGCYNT